MSQGSRLPRASCQSSTNGGEHPVWSRDGKELFFIAADGKMMAVETASDGAKLRAGALKPLFDARIGGPPLREQVALRRRYDATRDGRFLIPVPVAGEQFASAPSPSWSTGQPV